MSFLDVLQWIGESLDKPGAAARGLVSGDVGALANLAMAMLGHNALQGGTRR